MPKKIHLQTQAVNGTDSEAFKRKNFIVVVETVERKRKGRVILKINEIETLYAKKEKRNNILDS